MEEHRLEDRTSIPVFVSREIERPNRTPRARKQRKHRRPRAAAMQSSTGRRPARSAPTSRTAMPTRTRGWVIKTGICAVIALAVLGIRFIPSAFSDKAMSWLSATLDYDMDFSEPFGQSQFVQNLFPGIVAVFSPKNVQYQLPLQGDPVMSKTENGATFASSKDKDSVYACAPGRIIKRGISEQYGNYIRVSQADGCQVTYYQMESSDLAEGDTVKAGDLIGTLATNTLYLEIYRNSVAQNVEAFFAQEQAQ